MDGILNVLKPPGMTSHDVVAFVRRTYGMKRVGHAGTLDPAAAGVLPVFLGKATRLIEYSMDCDKEYRAEITFGTATDTGDMTGTVILHTEADFPSASSIRSCLQSFIGEQEQIPPMYSALKVNGQKLYDLARQGIKITRAPRAITIHHMEWITQNKARSCITIDVTCSKGTYIRALSRDIGKKLHMPAVLSFLLRTRVGNFTLPEAMTLEEIEQNHPLLPLDAALGNYPAIRVNATQAIALQHGQYLPMECQADGIVRVYNDDGLLLAMARAEAKAGGIRPLKVLI